VCAVPPGQCERYPEGMVVVGLRRGAVRFISTSEVSSFMRMCALYVNSACYRQPVGVAAELQLHHAPVGSLSFSCGMLLTASWDETAKIVDLNTHEASGWFPFLFSQTCRWPASSEGMKTACVY
jgi:hypothetical protein